MNESVYRPEATGSKINCYDDFELCYLRHQYIRKSSINPDDAAMMPFYGIIRNFSSRTYRTYLGLFQSVGMELEDIINIGKIQVVSYLGLYSVQFVPEKRDRFIDRYMEVNEKMPANEDFLNKDKADFTSFLKQRMEDLVRVCRQKVRNIRGAFSDEFMVFYGPQKLEVPRHELIKNFHKLGYKKLSPEKFRSLKKRLAKDEKGAEFQMNGNWYVCVSLDHRNLTQEDLINAGLDPYDAIHNMTPEEILLHNATEEEFQKRKKRWKNMSKDAKIKKIRDFISAKANDPRYTEEVNIAKRYLRE